MFFFLSFFGENVFSILAILAWFWTLCIAFLIWTLTLCLAYFVILYCLDQPSGLKSKQIISVYFSSCGFFCLDRILPFLSPDNSCSTQTSKSLKHLCDVPRRFYSLSHKPLCENLVHSFRCFLYWGLQLKSIVRVREVAQQVWVSAAKPEIPGPHVKRREPIPTSYPLIFIREHEHPHT